MDLAAIREILAVEPEILAEFEAEFRKSLKETEEEFNLNPFMLTLFRFWAYSIEEKRKPGYLEERKKDEILRREHPE